MEKRVIAVDLGASSGRVMAGLFDGNTIEYEEIYRFKNGAKQVDGKLFWDFGEISTHVKNGIKKAGEKYEIISIGIDTWGVDFGCLDADGNLLRNPMHYRDESTQGVPERVFEKISKSELYEKTGIQLMRFNTLYQLYRLKEDESELYEKTKTTLLIPDLLAYVLTKKMRTERTIASTTNVLSLRYDGFDKDVMSKTGLKDTFAPIIEPGQSYGNVDKSVAKELGIGQVPVVAVCCHDTASAVLAMPAIKENVAFISSGTWSLLGAELNFSVSNEKAMSANFTNEIGYNKTVRFLSNIMGLWILQQTKATYEENGKNVSFSDMEKMAQGITDNDVYIDVDAPAFELPGDMLSRVDEYLKNTNQHALDSDEKKIRCIYESLALKYAHRYKGLEEILGKKLSGLQIFGGGSQAKLLSQLSANAIGAEVTCGPCEATAIGNITVQEIARGALKDEVEARKVIANRPDIYHVLPSEKELWQTKYENYLKIINKENK